MDFQFMGNLIISGEIEALTGLHIGGSQESYEIGGMDNPVIRDPVKDLPYIPGSSLKGRMRSLLEWELGLVRLNGKGNAPPHMCEEPEEALNCPICRVFGISGHLSPAKGPTRLIVRDAYPTQETEEMMERLELEKGLPKTEWKTEVNIDRVTSKPVSGPRLMERVPPGAKFQFELVYGLYHLEGDGESLKDLEFLPHIFTALALVEDSFLGGTGSRGSGKVRFSIAGIELRTAEDYQHGGGRVLLKEGPKSPRELLAIDLAEQVKDALAGQAAV